MPRLMVLWTRPYHLSASEADEWSCREAARALEWDGVTRAELVRLQSASTQQASQWDWMLELQLRDGIDASACIESPACARWLGDLRLLGMRPAVVLAARSSTLPEASS
jgi:hypothetical protein